MQHESNRGICDSYPRWSLHLCDVLSLRSAQVDCTALAAAAVLLLPGFVLDVVALSAGSRGNRSLEFSVDALNNRDVILDGV